MSNLRKIERLEKKILKEEKRILKLESKILKASKNIHEAQENFLGPKGMMSLFARGFSKWEAKFIQNKAIKKVIKYKFLYTFLTLVGVVLMWSGLWSLLEHTPILGNKWVSLITGAILLIFLKRWESVV